MPAQRRTRSSSAASPTTVRKIRSPTPPQPSQAAHPQVSFRRDFNEAVYVCVRRIPEGRVCSYGQIARLIGHPRHSRMVGAALKAMPKRLALPFVAPTPPSSALPAGSDPEDRPADDNATAGDSNDQEEEGEQDGEAPLPEPAPNPLWVPWHRVVSSSGLISPRGNPAATARQAEWLEAEGVEVQRGPEARGPAAGRHGGGVEHGDAFGLGARVEGGGRVSMATYAWNG